MRTLITADIHGNFKALNQCVERSNFNKEDDRLIVLGDTVDGYPDVFECMEYLCSIKNLVYILGNHDKWCLDWFEYGIAESIWVNQGGSNTIKSYNRHPIRQSHIDLFKNAPLYFVENNKLFVHGGFKIGLPIQNQSENWLLWDRSLAEKISNKIEEPGKLSTYNEVFIGHTATELFSVTIPMHGYEIWNLDTGAGWSGKLTFMDLSTHKYWQSDKSNILYTEGHGRK